MGKEKIDNFPDWAAIEINTLQWAHVTPIWKTIRLGTFKNTDELHREADGKITSSANDLLGNMKIVEKKAKVDLVIKTVAQLGLRTGATYRQIVERAIGLGFRLCPAEVGLQLMWQYGDQSKGGDFLAVASEPLRGSDGHLCIFLLSFSRAGVLCLSSIDGRPDGIWLDSYQFVFVCPRN